MTYTVYVILQVICMLVVWHDPTTEHCQENIIKYVAVFVYVLGFQPLRRTVVMQHIRCTLLCLFTKVKK